MGEAMRVVSTKSWLLTITAIIGGFTFMGLEPEVCAAGKGKDRSWANLYEPNTYKELPYRLMKPANYDASKKYPLIVSLHGAGGRGNDNKKQLKDWNKQLADKDRRTKNPCYVLAPQSKGLWNKSQLKKIQALIKEIPSVDSNRIYILGHSMGGHGTYIFIQLAPKYFAAAAPSAGSGLKKTEKFIDPVKIKDIPIWAFHGDKDGVCPISKDIEVFEALKKLNGIMKLTTWKGGKHGVSDKFIPGDANSTTEQCSDRCESETDFMTWLFKQKLTGK